MGTVQGVPTRLQGQDPEFQAKKIQKNNFPVTKCAKLLTDLQILGCELHKNATDGRASSRTRWWGEAIALPQTSYWAIDGSILTKSLANFGENVEISRVLYICRGLCPFPRQQVYTSD